MKRILSLILFIMITASVFTGCGLIDQELNYGVDINLYVDGVLYRTVSTNGNGRISEPVAPEKENLIFIGWYTSDNELVAQKCDFSSGFLIDTNLYARYTIDAIEVTNMITNETMNSVVTVYNKSYNTAMGGLIESSSSTAQGSGVVIEISDDGWCYVLTNCHVVTMADGFSHQKLSVEDPWGNSYEAEIYENSKKAISAVSEDHDLALICFKYSYGEGEGLNKISLAHDPVIGDYVISLGTPLGQKNSVTYGKVLSLQKLKTENEDSIGDVKFDIVLHTAMIDHGSSGGPLLNVKGQLVGLNFAGYEEGVYGCAIPVSKINEFLDIYVYN